MATIVVEDGSVVSGANSFATRNELVAFAAARNVDLSSETEEVLDSWLLDASDYLRDESYFRYRGARKQYDQQMPAPRTGWQERNGPAIPSTVVPWRLKTAQLMAAFKRSQGTVLIESLENAGQQISSDKLGPMSTSWYRSNASIGDGTARTLFPDIYGLLAPLLRNPERPEATPLLGQTDWDAGPFMDDGFENDGS